jgi:hypothetical protein
VRSERGWQGMVIEVGGTVQIESRHVDDHTTRVDERVPLTVDYSAARGRLDAPPEVVVRQVSLPGASDSPKDGGC